MPRTDFPGGGLDQHMIVIVHHTVDIAEPFEAIYHAAEYCQASLPVNVIGNDCLSSIPAARDVIDRTGKFETQQARHGAHNSMAGMCYSKT